MKTLNYSIKLVMFVLFSLIIIDVYGQRTCGSVMNLEEIQQNDYPRYQRIMDLESQTNLYLLKKSQKSTGKIIIPVVVHVLYNNSTQNISDNQILSQIQVLNEDFRRENGDKEKTPSAFEGVAGSFDIEFRLARIDPLGNTTNGITRTLTPRIGFLQAPVNDMKFTSTFGKDAWNSQKYLNIWVCNFIDTKLLGYAQFPSDLATKPKTDGVVISYKYFGTMGTVQHPFNKGRTATHEVAHWLNLRHIWGDAANCTVTDFVNDTPNQYDRNYDCPNFPLTDACTPTSPGVMFMNYMDYTDDACMNLFTQGQVDRMLSLFDATSGVRKEMLVDAEYLTTRVGIDLMIGDYSNDKGDEPHFFREVWNCPNIWVRNQRDNGVTHQNPDYAANPNYVYVRVKNRGTTTSTGNEQLMLYWAKAATSLEWPDNWDGNHYFPNTNYVLGDGINIRPIPVLDPGAETIMEIPWNVPNPHPYQSLTSEPWHFCLLARIVAPNDPMYWEQNNVPIDINARNNNNIGQRNLSIVNSNPGLPVAAVGVGNIYQKIKRFKLEFKPEEIDAPGFKPIHEVAEITARLNDILYRAWQQGGMEGTDIDYIGNQTILIKSANASLNNIILNPKEVGILSLQFNFLTQQVSGQDEYLYHVIQFDAETNEIVGGETYEIHNRGSRNMFDANAGDDILADKDATIHLQAQSIGEPALYNWYDQSGTLIHEGIDFTTSVTMAQKYKLEIIALADGYKDYDEVNVKLKPNKIVTVFPNPVSDQVTVSYNLNDANNAYISITNYYYSHIFHNYILDMTSNSGTFNISDYPAGVYVVTLICNGQIADTKTFIKQ